MSIERHENRLQVCCDTCPASYPNTYAAEDFDVMISDARTAGWRISRAPIEASSKADTADLFGSAARIAAKAGEHQQRFIHTCPSCRSHSPQGGMF